MCFDSHYSQKTSRMQIHVVCILLVELRYVLCVRVLACVHTCIQNVYSRVFDCARTFIFSLLHACVFLCVSTSASLKRDHLLIHKFQLGYKVTPKFAMKCSSSNYPKLPCITNIDDPTK
jgi:hypothetical protein